MAAGKFFIVLSLGLLAVTLGQKFERPDDCPPCDPSLCDEAAVSSCGAGTVKDRCGCCDICAKTEYEMCDHPESKNPKGLRYGICGNNLECRLREDLTDKEAPEALCFCLDQTTICGTDGNTYNNKCALKAAEGRSGEEIGIEFKGPCKNAPKILNGPHNVKNKTGSNIFLDCEAKGFPIPDIDWIVTRADGSVIILPNDDDHVSVNVRGGPEKWEITSWLQIQTLKKHHEGDYKCVVQNEFGQDSATARVNVIDDEDDKKKHHKKHNNKKHVNEF